MKNISNLLLILLIGLTACEIEDQKTPPSPTPSSSQPTTTTIKILPTPLSPGGAIVWEQLQVTMDQLEITQDYLTEFGSTRTPPAGSKFLWVHIRLHHTGRIEMEVPISEHFSILYAATELKPTYAHRAGNPDYTALDPVIFPDQILEGWLRFDIPAAAELSELRFVYLPASSQVGASYNSPNYPYSDNKPIYVWKCAL
jgi:hypothetical protein